MKAWHWIAGLAAAALVLSTTRLRWPLDSVAITSPFGAKRPYGSHNGVDLRAPVGTPVYAPGSGVVTALGTNRESGRYLVLTLDGSDALRAGFAHLNDWAVMQGDRVAAGELIAYTGKTGTQDPHLHYTLRRGNTWLNPQHVHA